VVWERVKSGGLVILVLKLSLAVLFFGATILPVAAASPVGQGGDDGRYTPRVSILVVPQPVLPEDLAVIEGAAVGLMNPGLGAIGAEQSWLDVSQGARVFDSKYDTPLNNLSATPPVVSGWGKAVLRAESAGVDIRPGLLGSVLRRNGLDPGVADYGLRAHPSSLALATLDGRLSRAKRCPGPDCSVPVSISTASLAEAAAFSAQRGRGELMVVIERPPVGEGEQLAIAIAGPGFAGMLRSPSTRTPGYVLTTDIAPTVLRHFGIGIPPAMSGLAIESGDRVDFDALAELEGRYRQVGESRGTALLIPLLVWSLVFGAVLLIGGGRYRVLAGSTFCLAVILLPAVLLLTASISPTAGVESAIAGLLPPALALLLVLRLPGWRAMAVACGLTVLAYSVDLVAGLDLTPRAVIGPNPGLGARFYGIGNELESTLMVLTSIGTGVALRVWGSDLTSRRQAGLFLLAGLAGTVIFASGSFGADVGAAIIFPVAAVVGAALVLNRPRLVWLGLTAAAVALLLLAAVDTLTGAETHFVRAVFEGGSGDSALDVVLHRLGATVDSFTRLSRLPVTLVAIALIVWAWLRRDRIEALLEDLPAVRAGLAAAAAGSLVGAVSNDSGSLFIQVGVLYVGLAILFAWLLSLDRAADRVEAAD
jgi:hypothetical protein